eukprot:2487179-Alexandrium_andersonii.AAC.1
MSASLVGSEMCIRDSCCPQASRALRKEVRPSTARPDTIVRPDLTRASLNDLSPLSLIHI